MTVRSSSISWQGRKRLVPALRAIYRAETAEMAEQRLAEFEAEWGKKYPAVGLAWRRDGTKLCPSSPIRQTFAG